MANTWLELQNGLSELFLPKKISKKRFMELYCNVQNYCISFSNNKIQKTKRPHSFSLEILYYGYHDLYNRIRKFLVGHLFAFQEEGRAQGSDEALLQFYAAKWKRYSYSSKVLNAVCHHLNKHWVMKEFNEGRDDIYDVFHLCLICWRDHFLKPLSHKLHRAILRTIAMERNGEVVDKNILVGVMASYLDLDEDDPLYKSFFHIYKEDFENQFLRDTQQFYIREINDFVVDKPITDYMKKVEKRLLEEGSVANRYVHHSTLNKLRSICGIVLIQNHMELLQDSFHQLIRDDCYEDLARLCRFVIGNGNVMSEFKSIFESLVNSDGLEAIKRLEEKENLDPKVYISTILHVYRKYDDLVRESLYKDNGFSTALDSACKNFINSNFITQTTYPGKSSELLARYCDCLLKKNSKMAADSDAEVALNQAIVVLKYLDDLDVFQKFYGILLGKRLLLHVSISEEAEISMLLKLKVACGYNYTSKFYRMFQDFVLAKGLNEGFKNFLEDSNEAIDIDFGVHVLTSGMWPFQHAETFTLPIELEKSLQLFEQFYHSQHSGRKLCWLYNLSRGELETACFRKRYSFQVSTFQMAILLKFNSAYAYTVQQLQEMTEIRMKVLMHALQTLMKARLLATEDETLCPTSTVSLNLEYNNKKLKVNLNVPLRTEVKNDHESTWRQINQERRYYIEAAIVRIMKMRKLLSHQQLVLEVINQLSSNFKVDVAPISTCINDLIRRGFVERTNQTDEYRYVA